MFGDTNFGLYSDANLSVTLVSLLDGDYDSNGTVDQVDLDLVLLNWGEELFNPFGEGWINDLPDGAIDQAELDAVLANWGNSVEGANANASAVPEHGAGGMLVLALVILCFRVRTRWDN